jgi:hypothetical protein
MDGDPRVMRLHAEAMSPDPPDDYHPRSGSGVAAPSTLPRASGRSKEIVSTVLELTGITVLAAGGWLIAPYVGLIIVGVALILLGAAVTR